MRREYMIEYREAREISLQDMAQKLKISKTLLWWLESSDQEVTHPNIAERVGKAYNLTPEQVESMMPENHRKSSPNYNPDMYKEPSDDWPEVKRNEVQGI